MPKDKAGEASTTPKTSNEMPALPNRVVHAGLDMYLDEACRQKDPDGTLLILEPLDPDDSIHELDFLPTRLDYQAGQLVHFRTDQHQMWEARWFHNPISNQVQRAWRVVAAGFVGAIIDEETIAKHRSSVEDLEKRLADKGQLVFQRTSAEVVN